MWRMETRMLKEIKELGNKKIMEAMKDTVAKQDDAIIRATSRARIAEGFGIAGLVFGVGALIIAAAHDDQYQEIIKDLRDQKTDIDALYDAVEDIGSYEPAVDQAMPNSEAADQEQEG